MFYQSLKIIPIPFQPFQELSPLFLTPAQAACPNQAVRKIPFPGLMIEVHNNPKAALCDGAQSLDMPQFETLMQDIKKRAAFEGKELQ